MRCKGRAVQVFAAPGGTHHNRELFGTQRLVDDHLRAATAHC